MSIITFFYLTLSGLTETRTENSADILSHVYLDEM